MRAIQNFVLNEANLHTAKAAKNLLCCDLAFS